MLFYQNDLVSETMPVRYKNFRSVNKFSSPIGPFPSASLYAISKQFIDKLPVSLEYSVDKFIKFYSNKFAGVKQPKERKRK